MSQRNQPPQHKNPTRQDRTALAPYNFVPITDRVVAFSEQVVELPTEEGGKKHALAVDHSQYDTRKFNGTIEVTLETKSPLYVRAPLELDEFAQTEQDKGSKPKLDHLQNKPDFFYTADKNKPVIPGSSLRGMIRAMVEIVAHGKLTPVTDQHLIYRAVGDTSSHGDAYRDQLFSSDNTRRNYYTPRFKGGYIRKNNEGEWVIQPAKAVKGTTFARINRRRIPRGLKRWHKSKNASEIYIQINEYDFKKVRGGFVHMKRLQVVEASDQPQAGLMKAALARSGSIPKKESEIVIFDVDETADSIPIPNDQDAKVADLVAAYKDQISPEQANLLGNNGVLIDKQPILYLMDKKGTLIFFGHTQMFRIPYKFSPRDMLPPEHRTEQLVDLAELMFGRVKRQDDQRGQQAIAGRIFVGDATTETTAPWIQDGEELLTPKILASPKPTTFQHYLTQSSPNVAKGKGLETYNSSPRRTTLRGHKLYWHKRNLKRRDYEAKPEDIKGKESQYTRMKPVREGVEFRFALRFENLSALELGALWWALALPVAGEHCHKLGMGKPLGLGSVKLTPKMNVFSPKKRYEKLFEDDAFATGRESESVSKALQDLAVKQFENFIVKRLGYSSFTAADRIQQLLAMLRWPGQPVEETRYMEIERHDPRAKRRKRNEYRDRPVLPKPTAT